jgi:aryl-alcohol dehydrogenase-like predicted oxidoreductase
MQSLNDLVRAGKVHYLGVSDTPAWIVAKANQYARMANLRPFVVYQGMWNASMRDFERDIIPMCISEGMGIAPYGVLGQGRFQTEKDFEERERENPGRKAMKVSEHDKKVSKALEELSRKKGVNLLDVALAYVRQKAPYVFPIVGGRKLEHIKGSIAALDVWLSDEEMKEVEASYEFDPGFPHTFLSGTMFNEETHRGAAKPADVWLTKALGNFDWVEEPKPIKPRNC